MALKAEGLGFEPTSRLATANGFRDRDGRELFSALEPRIRGTRDQRAALAAALSPETETLHG